MTAHAQDLPRSVVPAHVDVDVDIHVDGLTAKTLDVDDTDDDLDRPRPQSPLRARLGIPEGTQFHVLSFEGPDAYSRIGGLEPRVAGLCEALVQAGLETHLWYVGQPDLPGYEVRDGLHLHRWCQWLSQYHPVGVYDGQDSKVPDYAGSLPPVL